MALSRITNYIEADGADLNLQSSDTTITVNSILGQINFSAPSEASGTDAILLASNIKAFAEGTFAAGDNATTLEFSVGRSAASGSDGGRLQLTSAGNLILKNQNTADGSAPIITLQAGDTDIAADDLLGSIKFQAPDEGTGTDAILIAAEIAAFSEGDFSSSNNATGIVFRTGASETANDKMAITSGGDIKMVVDGASIFFGTSSEIELRHVADDGLILKHVGTGDGKEPSFTFQAGDNDIGANDVLGQINFQAPDEGAGTDAVLVASTIKCISEGDFSASNNATTLELSTGRSAAAGSDGGRLRLNSAGALEVKNQNTADDSFASLVLQTGDTDIAQDDILGKISFQAPDEGAGTDAITVAAAIQARSEGDFSASANTTTIDFMTGASEAAVKKMSLSSAAQLSLFTSASSTEFGRLSLTDTNNLSIGCTSTDHVGLTFGSTLLPRLNESNNDGGVDIGASSFRFQALYLSGGVRVGGTGTSNELDDYEEGTFTAAVGTNYSGTYSSIQYEYYTKVGQQVFYGLRISGRSNTSDTSQVNFTGFPFAVYAEHTAAVGMNDDEFGHAMINTAETLYFYNLTGGDFQYSQWPHTSGFARVQGSYRIA